MASEGIENYFDNQSIEVGMGPVAGENGSMKREQEEDPKSRLSMQQEYGSKKPMSPGGTENA